MTYTYRFANLLSDSDIAELELSNVRFDRRIIVPGSFSGSITVTNEDMASQVRAIQPGKSIVHVYRGADIWGTYIIWQKKISGKGSSVNVEFMGASLESWLYRRIIDSTDLVYTDVDQIEIMRDLVSRAQLGWAPYIDSANLGIEVQDGVSGILRTRRYDITEATSVGQRTEELANVNNGFEYMIRTYYNGSTRVRELVWGYPALNDTVKDVGFFYPGNITSYDFLYDAVDAGTVFWTRGDSIETDLTADSKPLMTPEPYHSTSYLDNSWPHLDKVIDYSSVKELATLEEYAQWWRDNRAGLVVIPTIEINNTDLATVFTPNELGARATFAITDPYFPLNPDGSPSYNGQFRIVGMEVSPDERGKSEQVRFITVSEFSPGSIGGVDNGNA